MCVYVQFRGHEEQKYKSQARIFMVDVSGKQSSQQLEIWLRPYNYVQYEPQDAPRAKSPSHWNEGLGSHSGLHSFTELASKPPHSTHQRQRNARYSGAISHRWENDYLVVKEFTLHGLVQCTVGCLLRFYIQHKCYPTQWPSVGGTGQCYQDRLQSQAAVHRREAWTSHYPLSRRVCACNAGWQGCQPAEADSDWAAPVALGTAPDSPNKSCVQVCRSKNCQCFHWQCIHSKSNDYP